MERSKTPAVPPSNSSAVMIYKFEDNIIARRSTPSCFCRNDCRTFCD